MFFAVDEKLRCRGYGSRILKALALRKPRNKLVLSIEPCYKDAVNLDERVKRKRFYMKNGYNETGYMTRITGQTQEILIRNGVFNKAQFKWFFALYSNLTMYPKVWRITENDGLIK